MTRIKGAIFAIIAVSLAFVFPFSLSAAADEGAAALTRDVDRVESLRAVKALQYELAQYMEAGAWKKAAGLFAEKGEWRDGEATAKGAKAIEKRLRASFGMGADGLAPQTIHAPFFMMPVATLSQDGETARVRWHGVAMIGGLGVGAQWRGGVYENIYVREGGAWKISVLAYEPFMTGDYREGWSNPEKTRPIYPYHYTAEEMGRTVLLGADAPASAEAASVDALSGRIAELNDEAAIRNLQNAYGYYVDRRMWDDVVDLFETDGALTVAGAGTYDGANGVRRYLERDGGPGLRYGETNDHIQANMVVVIAADGEHARARGMELGMLGRNEGTAFWSVSLFDNIYVKRDGVWRIAHMRLAPRMRTRQALGWGESWDPEIIPEDYEPDRPDADGFPHDFPWEEDRPAYESGGADLEKAKAALWRAASYDAIENLAGAYADFLDDRQWDLLGKIFAAEGERDSAGGGFIRGPARITSFSRERYGSYSPDRQLYSMHIRTQPVINVAPDGKTAQERTRLFQTLIGQADAPPSKYETGMIMTGMYEDDVVVEDGVWRFKRVDIDHILYTLDYAHGWTRIPEGTGRLMSPQPSADTHFDAPGAGDPYPVFPKIGHMWFHYKNPVSGREPPLLMPKHDLPEDE